MSQWDISILKKVATHTNVMTSIEPRHYDLQIIPDLDSFTFDGKAIIDFEASGVVDKVTLDALELQVHSISFSSDDQEGISVSYELDIEEQDLHVDLSSIDTGKEFSLIIDYSGEINDKLAGFYRSKFEVDGEVEYCAVTQFQENDARRAFPCFDTPEYKTTYDIEFIVDQHYYTISNTSIEEEEELPEGKKRVKFERTPRMSSYLVFFGVGNFEFIEDHHRNVPIKLLASPGKPQKYGQLGLDYGIKSLKYGEEYFEIDYPLSKLDLIATPDFAAGAMENWGAILFRENLLLYYPGITSKGNEISIRNVIAHEVAHQWYGNLVSPNSWKYTWLNESFATFFAYKTVDHYNPELKVWDYFVKGQTSIALGADGYHETAPIEQQGEGHAAYTIKTVPILYNKGSSVLRQLEAYLGNEVFQEGLQLYLNRHAYDVAGSDDLWVALEDASGRPVSTLMDGWVKQMGYPLITVERNGTKITLNQQRFSYLNKSYDTRWLIPITLREYLKNESIQDSIHLMEEDELILVLDDHMDTLKINTDHTGFYRVFYDEQTYLELGDLISEKTLSPIDRFNIITDRYSFLQCGKLSLEDYLSYLDFYKEEDNHLSIAAINSQLGRLYRLLENNYRERIVNKGIEFLESVMDRIGYEPVEDENHTISILRGDLLTTAHKFGSEPVRKLAMEKFDRLKQGEQIDPNLFLAVLTIGARETNNWDWFEGNFKSASNEVELMNYGAAMSAFTSKELIEKQKLFIFDSIPARNRGRAITVLTNNEIARGEVWEWYLANLDNFEKLHPFIYQRSLTDVIVASVDEKEEVEEFFANYVKNNPRVKDPVDKGMETLAIRSQLVDRITSS